MAESDNVDRPQMMRELYACLYAREFPAQALLRLRPELHNSACVVMDGKPPSEQICSLTTKARLRGMSHGMTRVEVDTFADAVALSRSRHTEEATKTVLLECAGAFSPRIEVLSEDMVFLCCIDITGTHNLFGSPEMLSRNLLERVRSLGISAQITVSSNFHASVCLARGLPHNLPVQVIEPGEEAPVLAPLPLAVLDLTEGQAETFALWGIRTVGMLAALPEEELISRMGQEGKRLRQQARGELPHLFQPVEPAFVLEEQVALDTPVELLDSLLFVIGVMVDQLILRAKTQIMALASITITLSLDGGGSHRRTVRPALPSTDKQLWIKLLHLDLEAHPPQASILAIALHAEPGSTSKVQLGIFSPNFLKQLVWMSRLLASAPSLARGMLAMLCSKTHMRQKVFISSLSLYLPATLRQLRLRNSEPQYGSFVHQRQFRSLCKVRDRERSSFATSVTQWNAPMVRGLQKETGGT